MKFCDALKTLYKEMGASGVSLGAGLLQEREGMNCEHDKTPDNMTLCPTVFANTSLSSAEQWNSNTEWEALGILHGLETFHHYCFAKELYVITDNEPLVTVVNEDVAMLFKQSQCVMLCTDKYSIHIFLHAWPWNTGLNLSHIGNPATTMHRTVTRISQVWI